MVCRIQYSAHCKVASYSMQCTAQQSRKNNTQNFAYSIGTQHVMYSTMWRGGRYGKLSTLKNGMAWSTQKILMEHKKYNTVEIGRGTENKGRIYTSNIQEEMNMTEKKIHNMATK